MALEKIPAAGLEAGSVNATAIAVNSIPSSRLTTTGVVANSYGNSSQIPVVTIDSAGRITNASTTAVAGVTGFSYEGANNTFSITTGDGSTFKANISANSIAALALGSSGVVANVYGNATAIPVITIDEDGRISNATTTSVSGVTGVSYTAANSTLTVSTSISNYTAPLTAGNSSVQGLLKVVDGVANGSTDVAASANSVKTAYELASNAVSNATSYAATAYSNAVSQATTLAGTAYSNAVSQATTLAGTAYSNAVATAAADATSKSDTAYSNAVSQATTLAGAAYSNAVSVAASDATTKANTAYSNAVSVAASDATTKANTAYSNAVSQATTLAGNAYTNAVSQATTLAGTAYSNATSYADTKAGTAYSNATTFASNADNISSGTLSGARIQANNGIIGNTSGVFVRAGTGVTVNATGVHTNQDISNTANVTFGYMTITGNLVVQGTTTTVNTVNLSVQDNMIYLNSNNTVANPDLGFAGNYNDGTYHHAGFFRDATDARWKVFDNYLPEPDATAYIDTSNTSFQLANFQANVVYANLTGNVTGNVSGSANSSTYVGGNTAGDLRSYSDTVAGTAYSNAIAYSSSNSYVNSTFLKLSGGTMTGSVANASFTGTVVSTGSIHANGTGGSTGGYFGTIKVGYGAAYGTIERTDSDLYLQYNNVYNVYTGYGGGFLYAYNSTRSPIFYDSDNTGYYVNPSSSSNIGSLTSNSNLNLQTGTGDAVYHQIQSTNSIATYAYLRLTTTSGDGYLIRNRATGNSVTDKSLYLWNDPGPIEFVPNGNVSIRTTLSTTGILSVATDIRSPLFYDSDNTGYYVDPASGSNLYGTLVNTGGTAMTSGWNRSMMLSANYPVLVWNSGNTSYSGIGVDYSNAPSRFYFWINGTSADVTGTGTIAMSMHSGNYVTATGSFRAPIFYDSDDTTYYTNPAGSSYIKALSVGGDSGQSTYPLYAMSGQKYLVGLRNTAAANSGYYWWLAHDDDLIFHRNGSGDKFNFTGAGHGTATASWRAPIFYDSDNTSYYTDPASTSSLVGLTVSNTISGNISGYSKWIDKVPAYQWSSSTLPSGYNSGVETSFVSAAQGWPQYGVVLSVMGRDTGDPGGNFQLYMGHGASYGGLGLRVRSVNQATNLWTAWKILLDESNYTSYAMPAGSSATNSVDVRAPIFYDSDNTGYYVDPASTSMLNTLKVGTGPGGSTAGNLYINGNYSWRWIAGYSPSYGVGNGFGLYSDTIGAYLLSLSTSGNWWFGSNNHDSSYRVSINGTGYASSDFRAPIFYDSDNTTYYLDPAGSTSLSIYRDITFGYSNPYLTASSYIIVPGGAFFNSGTVYIQSPLQARGGINNDTGAALVLTGGTSGYTEINGSTRSPIYYDLNDTGYYVDPASTSDTALRMRGGALFGPNTTWGTYLAVGGNGNISTSYASVATTDGNLHLDSKSGNSTYLNYYAGSNVYFGNGASGGIFAQVANDGSFRSPIYYDYSNTGYYVDPASTSNLYGLTVNQTITGSVSGNAGTAGGLSVHSGRNNEGDKIVRTDSNGYIQAGWINTVSGNSGSGTRIDRIYCSSDQYLRYLSLTEFKMQMGLSAKSNHQRHVDYTGDPNYWVGSMGNNGYGANETFHGGSGFFDIWSGTNYPSGTSHIHGFNALHYTTNSLGSTGGNAYGWQMASQYDQNGRFYTRSCTSGVFSSWYEGVRYGYNVAGNLFGNILYDSDNTGYYLDPNASTSLNVAGAIQAGGNITAYYSDDRLKTKLGAIENAIDKVKSLNGFYYEANEVAQKLGYKVKREVGLSAQEIQAILPEIVAPAPIDNRYLTIDYQRVVPLLVEAIKEQQSTIERLEALVNSLINKTGE